MIKFPSISLRWVVIIVVVSGVAGFLSYRWKVSAIKSEYKEFVVKKEDIQVLILSTGTVQPENRLEIKAPIPGRIDKVLVQEGDKVKKGQIIAWMSSTDRAALLDAARSQGPLEVKKWEEIYRATPIVAPLPGMIIRRSVEPGQTITSTEAIIVMSDRLTVKAQVDETDLGKIKLKQHAMIALDAYPNEKISAIVDQIAYEARTVNNVTTYVVDVLPESTPEMMRSGMTANVSFFVERKNGVLAIPNEVLITKDKDAKTLLKKGDEAPVEVILQLGITNGKVTEILSGLSEGDTVVRPEANNQGSNGKNPFSPMGGRRPPTGGGRR